jgi:Short C-terminal domain
VSEYMVREEGKNGKVEIYDDRIVRTRKKTMGKDDVQTIPIAAITGVSHDRKTLGTDEVKLTVGSVTYEWKVKNAEQMVAELHSKMFASGSSGPPPSAMPAEASRSQGDKLASLERLASLHASGALNDEEYASMKAEVLGSDPAQGQASTSEAPPLPEQP